MAISVSPPISYTKSCKITALQSKSSHFSKQFAVTFRLLPFVVLLGSSADVLWLLTFPLQVTIAHCSLMGRLAQGNHILWSDTAITEALFLLSVTNCSKLWNKMVTRIWWDFFCSALGLHTTVDDLPYPDVVSGRLCLGYLLIVFEAASGSNSCPMECWQNVMDLIFESVGNSKI